MMSNRDIPLAERDCRDDGQDSVLTSYSPHLRDELLKIKAFGRGTFGRATTQDVFDRALLALLAVYDLGAEHADVSDLLHLLGIRTKNGSRLPIGTVSAAMHRAKMRAEAAAQGRNPTQTPPPLPEPPYPQRNELEQSDETPSLSLVRKMSEVAAPMAGLSGPASARLPSPARAPPAGRLDLAQTTSFLQTIRRHDD